MTGLRRISTVSGRVTRWGLPACLVAAGLAAAPVEAQQDCRWLAPSGTLRQQALGPGGTNLIVRVATPRVVCAGGIEIQARDSARYLPAAGVFLLFGRSSYTDPDRRLVADRIEWQRRQGRLQASGNAEASRRSDGTTIVADRLDFLEAGGGRAQDELIATGLPRPYALIRPGAGTDVSVVPPDPEPAAAARDSLAGADSAAVTGDSVPEGFAPDAFELPAADTAGGTPYRVEADRLTFRGEERLLASGEVEIERDSLRAFASAAEFSQPDSLMMLRVDARIVTEGSDLVGDSIRGTLVEGGLRDLLAMGEAELRGDSLRVAAPRIHLFLEEGEVDRVVATGLPPQGPPGLEQPALPEVEGDVFAMDAPPRPVTLAEDLRLVSDSIDVGLTGGRVRRLIAVGSARAESSARDSLNVEGTPEVARNDWIVGDTVVARLQPRGRQAERFEVGPPLREEERGERDADAEYVLESLVARSGARALYRLPPSDTAAAAVGDGGPGRPAIHLVAGRAITIRMEGGEAQTMTVEGQTFGSHFEPVALTALQRAARDSGAVADTVQPPDTGVVRDTTTLPDTGRAAAAGGREPSSGEGSPGARTPEPSPDGAGGDGSERSPPRKSPGPSGEEKR